MALVESPPAATELPGESAESGVSLAAGVIGLGDMLYSPGSLFEEPAAADRWILFAPDYPGLLDNASAFFEGEVPTRAVVLDLSGIEAMNRQGVGSVMALVAYLMEHGVTITLTGLRGQALLRLEEVSAWLVLSREEDFPLGGN